MSPLGRQQVVRRVPLEPLLLVYGGRLDAPSSRWSRAIITTGGYRPSAEVSHGKMPVFNARVHALAEPGVRVV